MSRFPLGSARSVLLAVDPSEFVQHMLQSPDEESDPGVGVRRPARSTSSRLVIPSSVRHNCTNDVPHNTASPDSESRSMDLAVLGLV